MCGINGIIKFEKKIQTSEIEAMNKKIEHRGPDDSGFYICEKKNYSLGFGHLRLSILDLSKKGHQPMGYFERKNNIIYKDKELNMSDYIIVFNGEIYNFSEIKKKLQSKKWKFDTGTDTEILLKGYIQWGTKILDYLNGMFAFVIYDKKKDQLFGARDRFGKKPLKYFFDGNKFIFSSELKAILTQNIDREVDLDAVDDYLTLQYVPAPKTGFKNIYKLPHSHYFILDLNTKKLEIQKYWDLKYLPKTKKSEKKIKECLEKKIKDCVKRRMIADVEVGAFLSGGVDSSAIVAFASKFKKKLKTFTIKFSEKTYDESQYARQVAEQYKTDHHEFLVKPNDMLDVIETLVYQYEEPYADSSQLPTYILAKKTSKYVKVALNGDGGDENFGGYDKYEKHLIAQKYIWLPFTKLGGLFFKFLSKIFNSLFFYKVFLFLETLKQKDYIKHMNYTHYFDVFSKNKLYKKFIKEKIKKEKYIAFQNKLKYQKCIGIDRIFYLDFNTYIPDDLMVKVDIATMAHGLESRSPILDYTFVEYAASIPFKYKIKGKNRKKIFKNMLEKYLPKSILYRKKKGFGVPIDYWFRNELKNYIQKILLNPKGLVLTLFKETEIQILLRDQFRGKDNGKKLWVLMILNLWYKKFFEKN